MFYGFYEDELMAYAIFGFILNFVFSIMFGLYLSKNIGIDEMIKTKGSAEQSILASLSIFIPYAKMALTLYRVAILQLFFLNKGRTHKEFWIEMTSR